MCLISGTDLPIHYARIYMVDSYTAELKNHKTVKIGGWALAETIRYFMPSILSQIHSS